MKAALALTVLVLTGALPASRAAGDAPAFSNGKNSFSLRLRGEVSPYHVIAISVVPGEKISIEVPGGPAAGTFAAKAPAGELRKPRARSWDWTAPRDTGLYPLEISKDGTTELAIVNAFVTVPLTQVRNERLNGYRIGSYPTTPLKGLEIYKPPRGLIEVTAANVDTQVSPHFRLRQFLCKQEGDYPKYVVLRTRLLLKLEHVLEQVNTAGLRAHGFHVMSGYRTPFYNKAIGNVKYSRHVYGGAADIFIDEDGDGQMDDLDGNGRIDVQDAGVLYDLIDRQYGKPAYAQYHGGLGRYKANPAHGPFVHVDVRGTRARWGD